VSTTELTDASGKKVQFVEIEAEINFDAAQIDTLLKAIKSTRPGSIRDQDQQTSALSVPEWRHHPGAAVRPSSCYAAFTSTGFFDRPLFQIDCVYIEGSRSWMIVCAGSSAHVFVADKPRP